MLENYIVTVSIIILIYFTILGTGYTILLLASFPDVLRYFKEAEHGNIAELISGGDLIPVTVIISAYNEENRILNCLDSIFNSDYDRVNIIVVSDGSTDNTVQLLLDKYDMYEVPAVVKQKIKTGLIRHYYESSKYPNITVIDTAHSNVGDSLNVGLNACRTPLYATVDADTILEPEAISRIVFTFLSNSHCVVVGGAVYILNGNKVKHGKFLEPKKMPNSVVPAIQSCEYLRSFLYGRSGWNTLGGSLSYAGAFTFFERQIVIDAGGYDNAGNFAQDAEVIVKLHAYMREHRYPYTIHFTPNAFAWTEVPGTLKTFWRQRNRWQRGMLRSYMPYLRMLFNPRYGRQGLFTYPFFIAFEVFGPVIEFFAYVNLALGLWLGIISPQVVILFILLAWGFIGFLTIATLFLNLITFNQYQKLSDILRVVVLVFVEMIGFRQYHIICKFFATLHYAYNRLRGKKL